MSIIKELSWDEELHNRIELYPVQRCMPRSTKLILDKSIISIILLVILCFLSLTAASEFEHELESRQFYGQNGGKYTEGALIVTFKE